jgi:hypothetical protein
MNGEGMGWIQLAQDTVQRLDLMNTLIKCQILWNAGNYIYQPKEYQFLK